MLAEILPEDAVRAQPRAGQDVLLAYTKDVREILTSAEPAVRLEQSVDLGHASRLSQRGPELLTGSEHRRASSYPQASVDDSPVKVCATLQLHNLLWCYLYCNMRLRISTLVSTNRACILRGLSIAAGTNQHPCMGPACVFLGGSHS